jgi:hypothetical protein
MPKITTLSKIAASLNTELKVVLAPRINIEKFLEKKAAKKAEELVRLSKTSAGLELQSPSKEESKDQVDMIKKEILEKKRDILWDQPQLKK